MKTRDLVRVLTEADPSGDLECVVGGEDIYFAERLPMYHDGFPTLLVHDPAKAGSEWSIVGLRVPAAGGEKVRVVTLGPGDVFLDLPDAPVEYGDEHARQRRGAGIEAERAAARRALAGATVERPLAGIGDPEAFVLAVDEVLAQFPTGGEGWLALNDRVARLRAARGKP